MAAAQFTDFSGNRVALIGDTHGDADWTVPVIHSLGQSGVDCAVQLGDFGWWPELRQSFVQKVGRAAAAHGMVFAFIDGNHEHHENLRKVVNKADPEALVSASPVLMPEGVWYLPRGCSWEWSGVKFRAVGGAFTVDRQGRVFGKSIFHCEAPSAAEIEKAAAAGPADVLLCHDYPEFGHHVPSEYGGAVPLLDQHASRKVREQLAWLCSKIEPSLVVHGHWHHRYSLAKRGVRVEGLNRERSGEAVIILDLEDLCTAEWDGKLRRATYV